MRRKKKRRGGGFRAPPLTEKQILGWVDAYHKACRDWPKMSTKGRIPGSLGETWAKVDKALRHGYRSLPKGSSLRRLLEKKYGVRNQSTLPALTEGQIVKWAIAYHKVNGHWPPKDSLETIPGTNGEKWQNIDMALRVGLRGLPRGSSLIRLLGARLGVRNPVAAPRLAVKQILAWADRHFAAKGDWPRRKSGPILDAPGETWSAVATALGRGERGLPRLGSLARLLARYRNVPIASERPPLTRNQILAWADAFHRRTGAWPHSSSGRVALPPGESWLAINAALARGNRGLPKNSSLADLLREHRGVPHRLHRPDLKVSRLLAWADAFHRRTGKWPDRASGPIPESGGDTWLAVDKALWSGRRGFPRGWTVRRLLRENGRIA